jgi:glycosyltransferase involved in cell wall biosynthesis
MISVLIPVFNYQITPLVHELHSQFEILKMEFEIICIEDGSVDFLEENSQIESLENVTYKISKENIGRSKIRNLLAKKATFNWLLFLDADVVPVEKSFIKNYILAINTVNDKVFFGGIKNPINNTDSEKMLRWKYGKERENVALEIRKKNPFKHFLSSNFLIHKDVFNTIQFDERIEKYGFEDLLFGEELKKNGENIAQLDNLVFHNGIEISSTFLNKTKESLENLYFLKEQNFSNLENIKILSFFKKLETFKLTKIFGKLFTIIEGPLELNLKGKNPSLVIFDTYKLCYFCHIQQEN